jgi:hypothetical protein
VIAVIGGLVAAFAFAVATLCYARATSHLPTLAVLGLVMLLGLALVIPLILGFGLPANLTAADTSGSG